MHPPTMPNAWFASISRKLLTYVRHKLAGHAGCNVQIAASLVLKMYVYVILAAYFVQVQSPVPIKTHLTCLSLAVIDIILSV